MTESSPSEIGDYDYDDILDLMVKFDRSSVQEAISNMGAVVAIELTVTGQMFDGTSFEGIDRVFVIDKGKEQ